MIQTPWGDVCSYVRGVRRPPKLPEGDRLDLTSDPDVPALRGPNGVVVARFSARGLTEEVIEHEALEDLLYRSEVPERGRSPLGRSRPT